MRILKISFLIVLIVFVGVQFIPTKLNQSDNVLDTDFIVDNNVPLNIKNISQKANQN